MGADDVDLNLLRVLDALLTEGSVSAASARLHLSAPAVSRSLGRLRRALDDPLFVRSGRGLVPTPRATALQAEVRHALAEATRVLGPASERFDSSRLHQPFVISAGDAVIASIGLQIVDRIHAGAPQVEVTFLPDTNEAELLRSGEAHLDLGSAQGFGGEVTSEVLFTDRFVAVMRQGHPLQDQNLTPLRYASARHIVVSAKGRRHSAVDAALAELDLARTSVTVVPSFVVAAHLVVTSDAIAVLPWCIVRAFAQQLPLRAVELPVDAPELVVTQSWHQRNTNDTAHQWFRQVVRETCQSVT